jgi:hypothetical protein
MWLHNAYALERSEKKLASRDRTRSKCCQRPLLHPALLGLVQDARRALRDIHVPSESWDPVGIPALGMARMTESDRKEGISAYTECLTLAALRAVLANVEGDLLAWANQFLSDEFPGMESRVLLKRLPGLERLWVRRVRLSRERDDKRGQVVFDDYAAVHSPAKEDEVLKAAVHRARETARQVRELD